MEAGGLAALTQAHFNEAMKIVAQRFINAALQGELEHHLTRLPPPQPAGRSGSARQMPFFCPFWRWGQFLCRFEGQFLCRLTLKIVYLSLARCTYSGPMEWERIPLVEVVDWERA